MRLLQSPVCDRQLLESTTSLLSFYCVLKKTTSSDPFAHMQLIDSVRALCLHQVFIYGFIFHISHMEAEGLHNSDRDFKQCLKIPKSHQKLNKSTPAIKDIFESLHYSRHLEKFFFLVSFDSAVGSCVCHTGQHISGVHLVIIKESLVALVNGTTLQYTHTSHPTHKHSQLHPASRPHSCQPTFLLSSTSTSHQIHTSNIPAQLEQAPALQENGRSTPESYKPTQTPQPQNPSIQNHLTLVFPQPPQPPLFQVPNLVFPSIPPQHRGYMFHHRTQSRKYHQGLPG